MLYELIHLLKDYIIQNLIHKVIQKSHYTCPDWWLLLRAANSDKNFLFYSFNLLHSHK
jgi:hypothetical protein